MAVISVGDVGTVITLDCGVDISTATVKTIKVRKPTGETVSWAATLSEITAMSYTTGSGDLDIAGTWHFQAVVTMPGWTGSGEIATMDVSPTV